MCIEASQRFHFHAFALTLFFLSSLVFLIADSPPPPIVAVLLLFASPPPLEITIGFASVGPSLEIFASFASRWSYYFHIWFSFRRPPLEIFALRFLLPLLELLLLLLASFAPCWSYYFAPVGATKITICFLRSRWSYYLIGFVPLELFHLFRPIGATIINNNNKKQYF